MDERVKDGDEDPRDEPASAARETAAIPLGAGRSGATAHWSAIEPGSELSATVLFAAGFAFDPDRPVRESYRVQRKLGAGAMGQVLEIALAREQSQQHFALKLVARPRSAASPSLGASSERPTDAPTTAPTTQQDAATRWLTGLLRNEASKQEAAQRHGVTVARFVALVRLDDGALGLRMEMARGRSWGALVEEENLRRDEPPDIFRAIRATRKLLGQLRRVHSIREPGAPSGFVHSDIKPTNVFVDDADPTDPSVTLLDFGVATAGRAAFDDESAVLGRETFVLRQTGGTPGYAPPGHFNARPSPASDVHAAMVCLYELVALALPWDIDELDPSPAGFALLELRLSSPPRPVRALRAAIPADEAKALDRFFASTFAELQARSLAWSAVAAARDELSQERAAAMVDELSTLAGEHQRSLDALARELESLGIAAPPSPTPSLIVAPSAPPSVELEPPSAIDTAPTIVAARDADRGQRAWADTESDAPLALPLARRPWRPWALFALGLAALALSALAVRAGLAPSTAPPPLDASVARDAAPAGDAVEDHRSAPLDPGVSLAVAPSAPLDVRALPRAFRGARAVAAMTAPSLALDAARDPGASGPPATVLCVANARGVRVVARGGALDRDVELCSTDVLSDPSTQEFAGRSEMGAEVLRALPAVLCVGDGRWLTTVRRFTATNGAQTWLFTCARPAPDPVVPPPVDASAAPPSGDEDASGAASAQSEPDAASAAEVAAREPDAASAAAAPAPDAQRSEPAPEPTPERDAATVAAPDPRPTIEPADAQP